MRFYWQDMSNENIADLLTDIERLIRKRGRMVAIVDEDDGIIAYALDSDNIANDIINALNKVAELNQLKGI